MYASTPSNRYLIVREDTPRYGLSPQYEDDGSERIATGSVTVAADVHWTATLTVPLADPHVTFVQIERRGPLPLGYLGSGETADFSLPSRELDVVLSLLAGVVAQARRDGVLPPH
jgi:hypothetical protein